MPGDRKLYPSRGGLGSPVLDRPTNLVQNQLMPAETSYRDESHAPTRRDVDGMPGDVLLEFGSPSCGICRALAPKVTALLEQHPEVRHIKVEDGPGRPLGRSFHVRLWPNLVFLRDGRVIRQLARPGLEQLEEAFSSLSSAPSGPASPG